MITKISSPVLLLIICALLCCDTAIRLAQAKEPGVPASIAAHQFLLVNDAGKVSAKIEDSQGKGPAIMMFDRNGVARTVIATDPDGGCILSFMDSHSDPTLILSQDSKTSYVSIGEPNKQGMMLSAGKDGTAEIEVDDEHENPRIILGYSTVDSGGIGFYDANGKRKSELTEAGVTLGPTK